MKPTRQLHDFGQSIRVGNITRKLLDSGADGHYIAEFSVTGLTSNPTIFDHAIKNSADYDAAIRSKLAQGQSREELFFALAQEDFTRAADLFRLIFERVSSAPARLTAIVVDALDERLQDEGAAEFAKSCNEPIAPIASKSAALA